MNPVVINSPISNNIIYANYLTVSGTAEVDSQISISSNNGSLTHDDIDLSDINGNFSIDISKLNEGNHTLTIQSTKNGLVENTNVNIKVIIPLKILFPKEGSTQLQHFTVKGTGQSGATVILRSTNGIVSQIETIILNGEFSIDLADVDEGDHNLWAIATKSNIDDQRDNVNITIKNTNLAITSPLTDTRTSDNTITVRGVVAENYTVKVNTLDTIIDGNHWYITLPSLSDGEHTLTAIAKSNNPSILDKSDEITITIIDNKAQDNYDDKDIQNTLNDLSVLNEKYDIAKNNADYAALKDEQKGLLQNLNAKTTTAVESVINDLTSKLDSFDFDFEYPSTIIQSAFEAHKKILKNDIPKSQTLFNELIKEEAKIIDEKFGINYNYLKATGASYSSSSNTNRNLTKGNKISIDFVDSSLSFSSGNYVSAKLRLYGDAIYTDTSMRKGNSVSYTNVGVVKSFANKDSYSYRIGNINSNSEYTGTNRTQKELKVDYSYTKAKDYNGLNTSNFKATNSNILFSDGELFDKFRLFFGLGGIFIYMSPYQFSIWTYFSIVRILNVGYTLQENYTSLVNIKFYTTDQKEAAIHKDFRGGKLSLAQMIRYRGIINKYEGAAEIQTGMSVTEEGTIITDMAGRNTLLKTVKKKPIDPKAPKKPIKRSRRVKTWMNIASVAIYSAVGGFAILALKLVKANHGDDGKANSNLSRNRNDFIHLPSGYNPQTLLVRFDTPKENENIENKTPTISGSKESGSSIKVTLNSQVLLDKPADTDTTFTFTIPNELALKNNSYTFKAISKKGTLSANDELSFNILMPLPTIIINDITDINIINSLENIHVLNINGTTTNVEEKLQVTLSLNSINYNAIVSANGKWSYDIPYNDVLLFEQGTVLVKANVHDSVGNNAEEYLITVEFR